MYLDLQAAHVNMYFRKNQSKIIHTFGNHDSGAKSKNLIFPNYYFFSIIWIILRVKTNLRLPQKIEILSDELL